jgi:sRNA-binding protein
MDNTTETPRKTLSIVRKPATPTNAATDTSAGAVKRSGKRIIKREELPAATLTRPGKFEPKPKKPAKATRKPRQPPKPPKTPPSELRARELSDSLNNFPVWREHQPLALGIERQIFQHIAELHLSASKRVVNKLLHYKTHNRAYLLNVGRGGSRFNLDGTEAGAILTHEQEHAGRALAAMPQTA